MKIKMFVLGVAAVLLTACASVPPADNLTMQEAALNLSSLKRDDYVILGRISGEATILAATSDIASETKKRAQGEPTYFTTKATGDTGKYGFIGEKADTNLTVTEKAIALATYNMLNTAKFNNADAVLYVTRQISISNTGSFIAPKSAVTAKVSGIAIQLKPDEGVVLKYPASQKVKEEKPVPMAEVAAPQPEQTVTEVAPETVASAVSDQSEQDDPAEETEATAE